MLVSVSGEFSIVGKSRWNFMEDLELDSSLVDRKLPDMRRF